MRKKIITIILSIIYSTCVIVGHSFMKTDSFKYIENNLLLNLIGYILLIIINNLILIKIFTFLDERKRKPTLTTKRNISKVSELFNNHTFIFSLIVILICWLPYIVSFYPAILSPDPSFQIKQYFKIPNKYSEYSIMLDPTVTITNHHPVVHTLLLGTCVKIGTLINNVNIGLFLYSMIQIIILSITLAYTIKFLKDHKLNSKYLTIMLLIYSFVPVFPFYSMSAVKDVIFGSLIILYIITIYKFIKSDYKNIKIIKTLILLILIVLFRNNGIHTIILSFPLLLLLKKNKKYKGKILLIFILIISFNYTYNSVILPYFKITPSSVRETLSIPFQQTARYVKEYGDEVSEYEKNVIDKVLNYNTLSGRYNSSIADPVKNEYNKFTTKEELKEYFKVWLLELKKHPKTYVEATISNTYGYYYPMKTNWYIYYKFDKRITEDGFNYHYNSLNGMRNILSKYGIVFPYIPGLNLIVNIGFNVWLLFFMAGYLIHKRKYKELVYLSPSYVLLLVCIASPVNVYFRYALPYVFALMLNFGLFIKEGVYNEK